MLLRLDGKKGEKEKQNERKIMTKDEKLLKDMRAKAPIVNFSETCLISLPKGCCGKETGMTEEGVDADLCLEHRNMMDSQRLENAKNWS